MFHPDYRFDTPTGRDLLAEIGLDPDTVREVAEDEQNLRCPDRGSVYLQGVTPVGRVDTHGLHALEDRIVHDLATVDLRHRADCVPIGVVLVQIAGRLPREGAAGLNAHGDVAHQVAHRLVVDDRLVPARRNRGGRRETSVPTATCYLNRTDHVLATRGGIRA